jgi:hypothetical protein
LNRLEPEEKTMHSIAAAQVILDRLEAAELRNSRPRGRKPRPGRVRLWLARRLVAAGARLAGARPVQLQWPGARAGARPT